MTGTCSLSTYTENLNSLKIFLQCFIGYCHHLSQLNDSNAHRRIFKMVSISINPKDYEARSELFKTKARLLITTVALLCILLISLFQFNYLTRDFSQQSIPPAVVYSTNILQEKVIMNTIRL